jgi:hypothetical protein
MDAEQQLWGLRCKKSTRIRLATLDGSFSSASDLCVRIFSLLNSGVHSEIWFDHFRIGAVGAEDSRHSCIQVCEMPEGSGPREGWHVLDLPVSDPHKALDFIARAHSYPIQYGISVPECAMPKFLLDECDHDVDCCRPDTWNRLFCSQFALLFLRYCAKSGILNIPADRAKLLWAVNSKGCLPSRLQIIAREVFATDG